MNSQKVSFNWVSYLFINWEVTVVNSVFEHFVGKSIAGIQEGQLVTLPKENTKEGRRIDIAQEFLNHFPPHVSTSPVLIRLGTNMYLFRSVEQLTCGVVRPNISCSSLENVDHSYLDWKVRANLWWVYEMVCRGPHISFGLDPELAIWLPRSPNMGIAAVFGGEDVHGSIKTFDTNIQVITQDIPEYLVEHKVSPLYVNDVVHPFLKKRPTGLHYRKYRPFSYEALDREAGSNGSFMYCGGPSCVYMWALQRNGENISWGGDYPPSVTPSLFFSTHLLGNERHYDWSRNQGGMWAGLGNMTRFRSKLFLFPAAGRHGAHPDWFHDLSFDTYTADVSTAMQHFTTTRFARYYSENVVEQYARLVNQ